VNQVTQSAFVAATGNRALERRLHALAEQAAHLAAIRGSISAIGIARQGHRRSANGAVRPLQRPQRKQTGFTNGEPGNSKKGRTTDTAIGRKESEE